MKSLFLTLAAALVLTACGTPAPNNSVANNNSKPANVGNSATAPAADTTASEAEIRKVMDATQAALSKNDADAMDKIYADNYMTVNQDGSMQTRAERLAALRSGNVKYDSFAFSDATIRVNPEGNGAIGISTLNLKGTFKGKPMDGTYRVTGIYSKTKDGWRLAGSQTTKIDSPAGLAKTADTKVDEKKTAIPPANK